MTVTGGSGTTRHASSAGIGTTIGANATFDGVAIRSAGTGIAANFTDPVYDRPADNTVTTLNLNNGTTIVSDTGTLLTVTRTVGTENPTTASATAGLVLNIGSGSSATGSIADTGTKTTGYLDIHIASGGTLTSDSIEGFRNITVDGNLLGHATLDLVAGTSLTGSGYVAHNVNVDGGTLGTDLVVKGTVTLASGSQVAVGDVSGTHTVGAGTQANIDNAGSGAVIDASAGTAHIATMTSGASLTTGNWGATVDALNGGTISGTGTVNATHVTGGEVNSGGLAVNNDGTGTGSVGELTLRAGTVLSGNGVIMANTTIVGGSLNPGNSPGTLIFEGDLTLDSETTTNIQLALAQSDLLQVSGNLFYAGTLAIELVDGYSPGLNDSFTLFEGYASESGTFDSIVFDRAGYEGSFDYASGALTITAVPEPSTYGLLGAGALAAVAAVRRRRRRRVA